MNYERIQKHHQTPKLNEQKETQMRPKGKTESDALTSLGLAQRRRERIRKDRKRRIRCCCLASLEQRNRNGNVGASFVGSNLSQAYFSSFLGTRWTSIAMRLQCRNWNLSCALLRWIGSLFDNFGSSNPTNYTSNLILIKCGLINVRSSIQ